MAMRPYATVAVATRFLFHCRSVPNDVNVSRCRLRGSVTVECWTCEVAIVVRGFFPSRSTFMYARNIGKLSLASTPGRYIEYKLWLR